MAAGGATADEGPAVLAAKERAGPGTIPTGVERIGSWCTRVGVCVSAKGASSGIVAGGVALSKVGRAAL